MVDLNNTLFLKGELERKITTQEQEILGFFRRYPDKAWTPLDVWRFEFDSRGIPYTSIRRGVTNLTNKGFLFKTGRLEKEMFGAKNNMWKLNRERINLFSELM